LTKCNLIDLLVVVFSGFRLSSRSSIHYPIDVCQRLETFHVFDLYFSPTSSRGGGCSGRTLCDVGSQEIYSRKTRLFLNRRERFDVEYRVWSVGLLVNIDRSAFLRFGGDRPGVWSEL
jgi:hypothetical protein